MLEANPLQSWLQGQYPIFCFFYVVNRASWFYRHCRGDSAFEKAVNMLMNFQYAFKKPLPSINKIDLLSGTVGALTLLAVILYRRSNAKKFRQGEEMDLPDGGRQRT